MTSDELSSMRIQLEGLSTLVDVLRMRVEILEAKPVEAIGTPIGDFPQSFPFLTSQVAG